MVRRVFWAWIAGIAAAESMGATVITADRTMIERVRKVDEQIELLGMPA